MNAYADTSVLLRLVLREPRALGQWPEIQHLVTSSLAEVECMRSLDRLMLRGTIDRGETAAARAAIYDILSGVEIVEVTRPVLSRAAQPLPVPLGTLDAIHLSTALLWVEHGGGNLTFATHDAELAVAARAMGLEVAGA